MSVSVRPEPTPNPSTMKFQFSERVSEKSQEFATAQETDISPLAQKLFGFPWTEKVFIGPDFVTVTKQDWVDWDVLQEPLAGLIAEHFQAGQPLWVDYTPSNDYDEGDTDIVKSIKDALARDIRPVVAMDGGDIVFAKFEEGILTLQMKGACAGCPSSQATLKEGIEVRMKELFPEIREVQAM